MYSNKNMKTMKCFLKLADYYLLSYINCDTTIHHATIDRLVIYLLFEYQIGYNK